MVKTSFPQETLALESGKFYDVFPMDSADVYVSANREPTEFGEVPHADERAGQVLRRLCVLGGDACAAVCQKPEGFISTLDKRCADQNLLGIVHQIGVLTENVLMVGVTADKTGFYDELKDSEEIKINSVGIRELPGYNAFFARNSEKVALGGRLADCGFAALEFKDANSEDVSGFVHLTRPNMQGDSALKYEYDGKPAGGFEMFLKEALDHYGGQLDSVKVRLVAAIKAENFPHTFPDEAKLERLFPGWVADGLMCNLNRPDWKPGEAFQPTDQWEPAYREMVMKQLLRSGLRPEQISTQGIIDPADLELGHSSNHAGHHGKMADARDAYIVVPKELVE